MTKRRQVEDAFERGGEKERREAARARATLVARNALKDDRVLRDERQTVLRAGGMSAVALVTHKAFSLAEVVPPLRDAVDWRPRRRTGDTDILRLDLARHLWGRYPVPAFLERIWLSLEVGLRPEQHFYLATSEQHQVYLNRVRWTAARHMNEWTTFAPWYAAAASGTSLFRTVAAGVLSRKEIHLFLGAPERLTPRQAVWRARLLAGGASPGAALTVAGGRFSADAGCWQSASNPAWESVGRFLCAEDELHGAETTEVLDWASAMIRANSNWSMRGRTLRTVRAACREWHRMVARQKKWSRENWTGLPVDDWSAMQGTRERNDLRGWRVTQILSGKELAAEGSAMRHCVASYFHKAVSGRCGLFSLRLARGLEIELEEFRRVLTLEVNDDFRVVQVRGVGNRPATQDERAVVGAWAASNGLTYGDTT